MKEDYQKALTLNPVSFNGQSYQEQKEPGTSSQFFRLQDKFRQIPLLVIHYLTKFDDIIWSSFGVIPKITSANLCKPIHDIINYSTSICPFEFGKCGKEGKKYKNTRICIEMKYFIAFGGLLFGEKIKNSSKIADTSFNCLFLIKICADSYISCYWLLNWNSVFWFWNLLILHKNQ